MIGRSNENVSISQVYETHENSFTNAGYIIPKLSKRIDRIDDYLHFKKVRIRIVHSLEKPKYEMRRCRHLGKVLTFMLCDNHILYFWKFIINTIFIVFVTVHVVNVV